MKAVIGKKLEITANVLSKTILALIKASSKKEVFNAYPLEVKSNG